MGLAEQQAALARLYTDPGLLARFYGEPLAVGAALGLSGAETAALAAIDRVRLERFTAGLHAKRRSGVARLLPRTCRTLGGQLGDIFAAHAREFTPAGAHPYRQDALAFAARLACQAPAGPPWLTDLARCEAAALLASEPACRLLVRRFAYPVARSAGDGEPQRRRLQLAVWLRLPGCKPWLLTLG